VIDVIKHAFTITGFVFVMMLVIEYLNVLTSGAWQARLAGHTRPRYSCGRSERLSSCMSSPNTCISTSRFEVASG